MEDIATDRQLRSLNGDHIILRGIVYAIAWIITISALFSGLAPLLLPFFLVLALCLMLVYGLLAGPRPLLELFSFAKNLGGALLLLVIYIAISSLWTARPDIALGKAALLGAVIGTCYVAYGLVQTLSWSQLHDFSRGIIIPLCVVVSVLVFELMFDHTILDFVARQYPGLIKNSGGNVPSFYLNSNLAVVILFFWPGLLIVRYWKNWHQREFLAFFVTVMAVVAVVASQNETAKVALFFSLIVFVFARFSPRAIHFAAIMMWVIAVLGVVPIVIALYATGIQDSSKLGYSARDRIYIWNYTAKQIKNAPLLGIGVRSSRFFEKDLPQQKHKPVAPVLRGHGGWHAHNIFLQTWYELGAVGAALLLICGLFLLQQIKRLELWMKPYFYSGFAAFATIAAFGYGMWQSWLLASFGWTVIFFFIAAAYARSSRRRDKDKSPPSFLDAKGRIWQLFGFPNDGSQSAGWSDHNFDNLLKELSMRKLLFLSVIPALFTILGFFTAHWLMSTQPQFAPQTRSLVVLSNSKKVTLSSSWEGRRFPMAGIDGSTEGKYSFSTNHQKNPWWQIDLGVVSTVDTINIFNRTDCCMEFAKNLVISVSNDGVQWQRVYIHDGTIFGGTRSLEPLLVKFSPVRKARHVRISLDDTNYLHLDEIIIKGYLPAYTVK